MVNPYIENKSHEIMNKLALLKGNTFASIESLTLEKLKGGQKNHMLGRVRKYMPSSRVFLSSNMSSNSYLNMVNRRLEKEGKPPHVLGKRPWGERIKETPFVFHKGQLYLEVIFLSEPKNITYYLDEDIIKKEDIIGLDEKKEGKQSGLDDKVIYRTISLNNIISVKCGEMFSVIPSQSPAIHIPEPNESEMIVIKMNPLVNIVRGIYE